MPINPGDVDRLDSVSVSTRVQMASYGLCMMWIEAALWGLFGGFAVEGLDLYVVVRRHGCWPWRVRGTREVGAAGYFIAELFRLIIASGLAWALTTSGQITTAFGAGHLFRLAHRL